MHHGYFNQKTIFEHFFSQVGYFRSITIKTIEASEFSNMAWKRVIHRKHRFVYAYGIKCDQIVINCQ